MDTKAKLFRVNNCMDLWAAYPFDAARFFVKQQRGSTWVSGDLTVSVREVFTEMCENLSFTFKYEDF